MHEQETSMQSVNSFGGVYLIILSTWNLEYALALQSIKTIYFHYLRHPVSLFMLLPFQSPFSAARTIRIDENNAKIFSLFRFMSSMESLFKG